MPIYLRDIYVMTSLWPKHIYLHINGLMQDCGNSIANAFELLQSYTEPFWEAWSNWAD